MRLVSQELRTQHCSYKWKVNQANLHLHGPYMIGTILGPFLAQPKNIALSVTFSVFTSTFHFRFFFHCDWFRFLCSSRRHSLKARYNSHHHWNNICPSNNADYAGITLKDWMCFLLKFLVPCHISGIKEIVNEIKWFASCLQKQIRQELSQQTNPWM